MAKKKSAQLSSKGKIPKKYEDISEDEIDKFNNQREKILLGESEEEYNSEDDFDEAIMDLPSGSEEEEYDEDDVLFDGENSQDDDEEDSKWGKSKKVYYSADGEAVEEEAAEAKKIQTKKMSQMRTEDFVGDKSIAKSKKSGPVSLDISEDDESEPEESELESEEGEDEFELNEQQVVELSTDEKIELLSKHSAEFKALVSDFKERLGQLQNHLEPLLPKLKEMPTSEGLSFLKVKYQLLTAYCTNVAFYLKLKLAGKSVQDHPVLGKLVKFRLLLEKIKPLEAKLLHQVDRLLKAAAGQVEASDAEATRFRPNPDMFVKDSGSEDGSGDEDQNGDGVYKAPKLQPMHFPEDESALARREKHEAYLKKVNSSNRLIQDIRAEFEDAPEEEALDVVYGSAKTKPGRRELVEREAYEEENFVRFTLDKKAKRRLKETAHKAIDELEDLNDFLGEMGPSKKNKSNKKASKQVEEPIAALPKQTKQKRPYLDDESDIEDDFYAKAKAAKMAKKSQKEQPKSKGPVKFRPLVDMKKEGDRPANWQMMKNKGLTPHRAKESKNPRVKQRMRFEKAEKRLGSFKAVHRAPSSKYGGEDSGIRSNLVRSTKF